MDQEQFKIFLDTLTSALGRQSPQAPQITPFENYDSQQERFRSYLERFGNYCDLKNISEDKKKVQLLCSSIGKVHYNNMAALLGSDNPIKELSFDTLVTHFSTMLSPAVSTVVAQHYFLNVTQQPQQSISDFVASLKGKLIDCDFYTTCECTKKISIADTFLRAQFIRGLRDNWIREQLLQLTLFKGFDDLLQKAIALEASRYEANQLVNPVDNPSAGVVDAHKLTHDNRHSREQFQNTSHRPIFPTRRRAQSRGRADYRALGIDGLCLNCGRANHTSRECRTERASLKCDLCHKVGHVAKVCITTLMHRSQTHALITQHSADGFETPEHKYGIGRIQAVDLYEVGPDQDKYFVTVTLNDQPQEFEVDSGARFSLLSETDFNNLGLRMPLQSTSVCFRSYSDHIIRPKGKVTLTVAYKDKKIDTDLFIVPPGHDALLGRGWIRGLQISLNEIDAHRPTHPESIHINSVVTLDDLFDKYSDIFEEKVGCVPNVEVKLQLRDGAKPIFIRERDVPFALRERVNKELATLESQGVITPVSSSDWGSPLVVIAKPDGGVRLCVDYKCGVNARLVAANHPIRRIDDILHSLRGSRFFCKLDLHKAYLHLKVDEEGSKIQTISTHQGTYRMNRLSFGIKTAPSEFNRILSQLLYGLKKVEAYFDDIICHGTTHSECTQNLIACLERLKEHDLHLNKSKCSFFRENVSYLGHIVSYNSIKKCPEKVTAVANMPHPKNTEELRRFLGLATYYAKFIHNFSSKTYELRRLLQKNIKFFWSAAAEASFLNLKSELCNDRVLTPFDPMKPVILTTDASPTGIAAILSHEIDGQERPIAYASRSLTPAEMNYSQLDREALAIIYAATHFYNYILGRHFVLVTDNEPLSRIFHPDRPLPQMTSGRLLRYASFLSGLNYSVRCKKSKENDNVDCLSRAAVPPGQSAELAVDAEVNALHAETLLQISSSVITAQTIAEETANDPELQALLRDLRENSCDSPFTISDNILFRLDRVMVPKSLQAPILEELHATHLGVTKMKQLARRYVYWEGLDKDIERLVKGCESCARVRHSPKKMVVHPWDQASENWERVHIDYAGPVEGHFLLMCVDARSKWAEVRMSRSPPSSASTISLLKDIFAVHGYPSVLVSDNAAIFTSEEFQRHCKSRGIFQKFSAPNHPATNGLAERSIQTLKRRLGAAEDDRRPLAEKVQTILFRYRATPLASGQSPAELYLKRKLRIRLDALLPNPGALRRSTPCAARIRSLQEGERVQARIHQGNRDVWQFGTITKKLGLYHYIIELDSGRSLKRHINQLISTLVPRKQVSFAPQAQGFGVPSPSSTTVDSSAQQGPSEEDTSAAGPSDHSAPPDLRRSQRQRHQPSYLRDYELRRVTDF